MSTSTDFDKELERIFDRYTKAVVNATAEEFSLATAQAEKEIKAIKQAVDKYVIGEDESAYSEDDSRYFEHIFHQNNLRKEMRGKLR